jgi:hypothetical protein
MFCPYCGTAAASTDARFCFHCGKELASTALASPTTQKSAVPSESRLPMSGWFIVASSLVGLSYIALSYIYLSGGGGSFKGTNLLGLILATAGLASYSWKKAGRNAWIGFFLGFVSSWTFLFLLMFTAGFFPRSQANVFDQFDPTPEDAPWKQYQQTPTLPAPSASDPLRLFTDKPKR